MSQTPRQTLERIQRFFEAATPVIGVPMVASTQLFQIAQGDMPECLERMAHFMRYVKETSAQRLDDVWASYYLAGHITPEQFNQSHSRLVGAWRELIGVELSDGDRESYLELMEESEWTASARTDLLS